MECAGILLLACLALPVLLKAQPGSSCATPHTIILDGQSRNYTISTVEGPPVICATYTSDKPVTWFSFTTNSQAECPLLNISTSDGLACEVAMYTACNGGQSLEDASSMCLDDGNGLWAPAETFTVTANKTYYLRIKTGGPGSITIAGQHHATTNDECEGASSLSTTAFTDNNSCHHGGPIVTPPQLCAFTLENTAFYQFYVASTGSSIININNIACDNGIAANNNGFQIGFFKGSCSGLVPINCTNGSGSFVQATTDPLDAGTKVFVAIDGINGSNCQYEISGINVYAVLSTGLKHFSAWKTGQHNMIRWAFENDHSIYYEIERSSDGVHFSAVGRVVAGTGDGMVRNYQFKDAASGSISFYRIRQMNPGGKIALSHTIYVKRNGFEKMNIRMVNPAREQLNLSIESEESSQLSYSITSSTGYTYTRGIMNCGSGTTSFRKDISNLPDGRYFLVISKNGVEVTESFVKLK